MKIFILLLTFFTTPLIGSFPIGVDLIEQMFLKSKPEVISKEDPHQYMYQYMYTKDCIYNIGSKEGRYYLIHTKKTLQYFIEHNIETLSEKNEAAVHFCFEHGIIVHVKYKDLQRHRAMLAASKKNPTHAYWDEPHTVERPKTNRTALKNITPSVPH